jgi:hypothetical protein
MTLRCLSVEVAALPGSADDDPPPDTGPLQSAIGEMFPDSHIKVVAADDGAVTIVGEVECAQEIGPILDLAGKFYDNVVNRIQVASPQQVQMRLLIAEVAQGKLDGTGIKTSSDEPAVKSGERTEFRLFSDRNVVFGKVDNAEDVHGFVRALKQHGHAKILAEPTLVTFTGRPASMVVGGEFPIIIPGEQGTFSVEFREYGTRIECLPIVLGKNRVRLEVRPELSTLDYANGVVHRGFIIPGIIQHRLDTSIELQSGETYVAGLGAHSVKSPDRGSSLIENAWCSRMALACLPGLLPCTPCMPDQNLLHAMRAIAEHVEAEPTELIVMVTAELVEPLKPGLVKGTAGTGHRPLAHPQPAATPFDFDFDLTQAGAEMDADQPHAPAILLTPLDKCPGDKDCGDRPRVRLSEARVSTHPTQRLLFGVGVDSDCGLAGNIVVHESEEIGSACRDNCCVKSDRCQPGDAACCKQSVHVQQFDVDECGDEDTGECVESFIAQVLDSQMQYLEGMMRARLHHANELMEAKAAAESAFAKQKAEHFAEIMKLRVEHMGEIIALQETIWDSERRALSDRHRDAIDHERELAELRAKHVEELQSQRIAALESEVKSLRSQVGSNAAERVVQSPDDLNRQSSAARRSAFVELPIQVEELTSGRVRYSPVPPKPSDQAATTEPDDVVERVELMTPPIAATRPTATEIERLRVEVARLQALIEDLICLAPEALPSPKPQSPDNEDD